MKHICLLVVISLAIILGYFALSRVQGVIAPVLGEKPVEAQNKQLEGYLDRLVSMENCGEGIIDENGLISKGDLCFQKSTYLYFVKKYEIYPYAEENELLSNWGDSWTQREITKRMIEEEVGQLAKHWYTSVIVRKLGLPKYD